MITINNVNILPNIKLLELLQRYLDFQKKNGYPPSDAIVITNVGGVIEFSIDQTKLPKTPVVLTPINDTFEAEIQGDLDTFDEFIDQILDDLTEDEDQIYSFKKLSRVSDYSVPILEIGRAHV